MESTKLSSELHTAQWQVTPAKHAHTIYAHNNSKHHKGFIIFSYVSLFGYVHESAGVQRDQSSTWVLRTKLTRAVHGVLNS